MEAVKNTYEIEGNVVKIFLNPRNGLGFYTLIDLDDLEEVASYPGTWTAMYNPKRPEYMYVNMKIPESAFSRYGFVNILLHRLVAKTPKGMLTDHINHNTIDNRSENLRNVTKGENNRNRLNPKWTKTRARGYYYAARERRWVVRIREESGKEAHTKYFVNEEDAKAEAQRRLEARKSKLVIGNRFGGIQSIKSTIAERDRRLEECSVEGQDGSGVVVPDSSRLQACL